MKKKFASLLLALAMTLSLAACGGGSTGGTTDGGANAGTEEAENAENAGAEDAGEAGTEAGGETAALPGGGNGTFQLGSIGPKTGDAAIYGTAVVNGARLACEEIAASDSAVKFEYQDQDDEADGEKSVNAYNALMDWGMQVLVGPTTTGASIAVAAKAAEDRTIMLTPSASSTDVTAVGDNIFQVCFTDPNQGVASADYMAENLPDAVVAVIYRNDDAYSQGIRDAFVKEAEAKGLNVAYEGTFTKDTATDFTVQLTAAQSAGATMIFLPIYYEPAAVIFNQARAMGYAPTFFGVDGMDGILTLEGFDTSLAEGVMLLTPFSADAEDERTQRFVAAYEEMFGIIPNQFAADAYDGVYIMREALEEAGCTADMSNAEICDAVVNALQQISYDGLTGEGLTWDASGAVSKDPMAFVIQDGVYARP